MLLRLAVPTVIIQVTLFIPSFLTASVVGRKFGSVYLSGYTLGSLTANLFTLSLLQGLFSAADTLSPQAFGAGNHREVGLLAIRGYLASLVIIIPTATWVNQAMRPILLHIGVANSTADLATQWYQNFIPAVPFYALYMVTWKFLSAQEIIRPVVVASLLSTGIILPLALQRWTDDFGFVGSAYANGFNLVCQAGLLLLYLAWKRPHVAESWPGVCSGWKDAMHWKAMKLYLLLGIGGMLAQSEWIYWETLSLMIGTLGAVPLAVHSIPTQVLNLTFMVPLGIGIALSIRLGSILPRSVARAKRLALGCFVASTVLIIIMTVFMYQYRFSIFRIFTSEPQIMQGCDEIWWKVCLYFLNLSLFGVNAGIAIGLGLQWTLGMVNFLALWGVGLPAAWYFAIHIHRSLDVAWSWIYPPYVAMNLALMIAFVTMDWNAISKSVRVREGIQDEDNVDEPLIKSTDPSSSSSQAYGSVITTGNDEILV
jgi:MATE family multidrug resistance protein